MLACSFTNFYLVLCQLVSRKHVMTCPIREYVYMGAGWGVSLRVLVCEIQYLCTRGICSKIFLKKSIL